MNTSKFHYPIRCILTPGTTSFLTISIFKSVLIDDQSALIRNRFFHAVIYEIDNYLLRTPNT